MSGQTNYGVVFKIGNANPPSTSLADVFNVDPPNTTRDAVDITTHGSAGGAMEFMPDGVYDPGDLTVSMNYTSASATDAACLAALASASAYYFQWTAKKASGTATFTAQGVVTAYGIDAMPVKGKQTAMMKVKLSGPVTVA